MASNPTRPPFRTVATGVWLYGGSVPTRIEIYAKPARFAASRYNDELGFDDTTPVPETDDGDLYCLRLAGGGEFRSVEEAKAWVDTQPWGPVKWDAARDE